MPAQETRDQLLKQMAEIEAKAAELRAALALLPEHLYPKLQDAFRQLGYHLAPAKWKEIAAKHEHFGRDFVESLEAAEHPSQEETTKYLDLVDSSLDQNPDSWLKIPA
ncbi:hypothetical protein PG994_003373 [Apiospora phragmitis]|uniref:Uncharacterized protein n=1 Tax=Apiospora phragmitis TaxID=2905665 RepID=A0ABR1W0M7_9PEZI